MKIDIQLLKDTVSNLEANARLFYGWANKIESWSKDKDGRQEEIAGLRLMGSQADANAAKIRKALDEG